MTLHPLDDAEAADAALRLAPLRDGLRHVVLGQPAAVHEVMTALLARGHVLLEGVPGTAKTLLARTLASLLGLSFRRVQFTPDLMPSDITGVNVLSGDDFVFRAGPLFADLVLADEINRAPAKTQAALLEAMQERRVTVDGTSHVLPSHFTVIATQNPVEFEGTYPLPEAELDRFLLKVIIDYPDDATEQGILQRALQGFDAADPASYGVAPVLDAAALGELRLATRRVRAEAPVVAYVTALVRGSRGMPSVALGASPRASLALLAAAQASALMDGRSYVVPDDVKACAKAVLRHRLVLAPELELEGLGADAVVQQLIDRTELPR
jgi:MoxR-like ATPase